MEAEEKKNSLKPLSHGRRSAKFFDITGYSLVHPMSYSMQGFQKQIIMTAIFRNTLISLPPGLGMPYLASVIIFNFQRWFLNGRIVILSQAKNCIVELMNALNSYTTLCKESYSDLYGSSSKVDNDADWNKPIVLSTPVKFLENIQNNVCKVNNLVLLIVYETNRVTKCQEYKDIMTLLTGLDFRVDVFIEGSGFNSKSLNQIIETFNISQIEFRNMSSEDIKGCTFYSEIESVSLEISPHMISIKDAFYAVYEKYGKLLKDARVINGNVASFTKNQVQKAREKLIKSPPQNMNKEVLQNLLDGMTMCSFLCVGIDILHNWGVRSFYNYLFDENKDSELKRLIVKDDHLKNQMKLLNEYLKSNGKKMELLMSRIVHPKLIYLKNLILRSFSEAEGIIDDFRMVIFCSMDEIIDDIDRLASSLPNYIRHQCVQTKSKSLSNTNDYKEVVQNFNSGVINVLALNNLVEEIHELGTNLIVSLEPNKTLIKFSDPRFHRGPDKCFFVLTSGVESQKFETLLNEKKNEQKSIELPQVDHILQNSSSLFPEGFNPDFESTSVGPLVRNLDQSTGQKSIANYLKPDTEAKSRKSISVFDNSDFIDSSVFVPKNAQRKLPSPECSPSFPLFDSKVGTSVANTSSFVQNEANEDELYDPFYTSPQPVPFTEQLCYSNASKDDDDSVYDLILDFAVPQRNDESRKSKKPVSHSNDEDDLDVVFCENEKLSKCGGNDMNHNEFKAPKTNEKPSLLSALQSLRDRATKLPLDLNASLSSDSVPNSEPTSPRSKSRLDFKIDDILDDFNSTELQNEMFKEITVLESSKNDSRSSKPRPSIDMVNATGQDSISLKKNEFKEVSFFDRSKDESRLNKNSRTSIDVVYDTFQNPASLKKNPPSKETSLFDSSKDESRLNKNSRTSIDVVYDTFQNPASLKKNPPSKETSLFDSSKDESRLNKNSRTSINVVYDTFQNPSSLKKNPPSKETSLFDSSKDESRLNKNSRTSIDVVYDTFQNPLSLKKNPPSKETSLFDSSKDESRSSKNSRSSIDVVYDTGQNPTMTQKNAFKEDTLFRCSKDDSRSGGNARTSIDFVKNTPQIQTSMKKFVFKEKTLFGSCKGDSRLNKNSRTSIDYTGQNATTEKNVFNEKTLFDSSKEDTRFCENSRTNIDLVNHTRPIPTRTKSPIFSTKKSNITSSENKQIPLKDQSVSIHFGSSFELDDDFLSDFNPNPSKATVDEKRPDERSPNNAPDRSMQSDDSSGENDVIDEKPPDVANIDDWDPDCDLFQDDDSFDNAVVDIATPQKDPISAKTSTPINNSTRVSSIAENPSVVDLISPRQESKNKTDCLEYENNPPVASPISTELPKPNRPLKKPSTDTCDIIINTDNCRKKAISNSFFSIFTASLKQRCLQNQNTQKSSTSTKSSKIDEDNDDFPWMRAKAKPPEKPQLKTNPDDDVVYPWMKKSPVKWPLPSFGSSSCLRKSPTEFVPLPKSHSPIAPITFASSSTASRVSTSSPLVAHSTPDFKKPGPFLIRSSASKSARSSSGSDQKSISGESPSELIPRKIKKKKTNFKRNLAKQFLDNEAEVSSDDSGDTIAEDDSNQSYENDSFIDDEVADKKTNYSHYLKSIKSPGRGLGKFRIPVLSESKLRMNVYSQMDYFDQTYQQDSFCVDDVDTLDQDSEYVPSVLTQMEDRLKFEKKKPRRLPTICSSEESSNEEGAGKAVVRHKKKHRKRIMCFSSSDDENRAK